MIFLLLWVVICVCSNSKNSYNFNNIGTYSADRYLFFMYIYDEMRTGDPVTTLSLMKYEEITYEEMSYVENNQVDESDSDSTTMVTIIVASVGAIAIVLSIAIVRHLRKGLKSAQKSRDGLIRDITQKNKRIRSARQDMRLMRGAWKVRSDEIERLHILGRGSQGEVWKATFRSKFTCVMKIMLSPSSSSSLSSNSSSKSVRSNDSACKKTVGSSNSKIDTDEAEFLMRIRHPRLLMFMGFGFDSDIESFFILTEYMEEGTLSNMLHENSIKKVSWSCKIRWLLDVSEGLSYLHSKGGLHRDLKSSNILISKEKDGMRVSWFVCVFPLLDM